jgi:serine/threonine-protein kinase
MQGARVVGRRAGRYLVYDPIASGGMATVHFGRMLGPAGFSRTVAIKRLHAHLARDPEFVSMFLDEARLAARVQHPNVVATMDIVTTGGEVFLVMEYVKGESLFGLLQAARKAGRDGAPVAIVLSILGGILHGLHAAHEALTDRGEPLDIVHRDVSPQNILVGEDGVARLVDFGVAKAQWRVQSTQGDKIKGKLSYMAPEQLGKQRIDRRVDVYAAAVVLWESLTGQRLFTGDNPAIILSEILRADVPPPSQLAPGVPPALDRLVLKGLSRRPEDRYATALEMVTDLERAMPAAPQSVVSAWVRETASIVLEQRAGRLASIEATPAEEEEAAATHEPVALRSAEAVRRLSSAPTAPEIQVRDIAPLLLVASDAAAPVPERRRVASAAVTGALFGGASVLAVLVVVLLFFAARRSPAAPVAPVALASNALVDAGESATATFATASPALVSSAAAPVAPAASAAPLLPVVPVVPVVAPAPAHPVRAHAGHVASSAARNCDPPYTLDPSSVSADGQPLKRFKPWCL